MRLIHAAATAFAAVLATTNLAMTNPAEAARPIWTATVSAGENGSHVLGDPKAKVHLTEFVSYTCPHCAHFHKESDAALKLAYVQTGKISLEVRHLIRDPVDLSAALLANCGDPKLFFRNHGLFLINQDKWIGRMGTATAGQKARWTAGSLGARMKAIANDFGFYAMMEQRGYRRSVLDQCLSDEAAARRLTAQTQSAVAAGVEGTPAFMLDDVLLAGTHDWQSLRTQLEARF